tara:strand:+ start:2290 stop:2598 length:309 start_codon:yes stop_codon:yes gene_type:complete
MGLKERYNKAVASGNTGKIIRNPNKPLESPFSNPNQEVSFGITSLDLENPNPLGGPINVSFTTKVGEDIVTSPTTQPYTPNSTYTDSFTDPRLIARTIDPFK